MGSSSSRDCAAEPQPVTAAAAPVAAEEPAAQNEVTAFLELAGLQAYTKIFQDNGFDDLESLRAMEDVDFKALDIPVHQAMRLKVKLQQEALQNGELDDSHPVVAFLTGAGLLRYALPLLQQGFDELDVLAEIEDKDLQAVGMPRGHVLKFWRKLREQQEQQQAAAEQPPVWQGLQKRPSLPSRISSWDSSCASSTALSLAPASSTAATSLPGAGRPKAGAPLTARQHGLPPMVQESWDLMQAKGLDHVAEVLYQNVAMQLPYLIALFGVDDGAVGIVAFQSILAKLVEYIGATLTGQGDRANLVFDLQKLGIASIPAEVTGQHWKDLGQVFDGTLRELLKDAYAPEVQRAWMTAYSFLSSMLSEGPRAMRPRKCTAHLGGGIGGAGLQATTCSSAAARAS